MNRHKKIYVLLAFFFSLVLHGQNHRQTSYVEITKEAYYDKTLACILGHIGGFLSGFEFVMKDGKPYVGLPDEWFSLCYGPYGGGPKHGSAGENCVIAHGQIRQDDDFHVDFFNQLIFDKSEHIPTSLDINRWWKYHQVRDWGGGQKAMEIMNKKDYVPPFTGQLECGNIYSWCTEPYIENETVGCVAPGMAQTADMLVSRFASTVGEYESVLWARFFGIMYALAYFETNAVDAMKKAAIILPQWSHAKFIYEKALELHLKYPDNWRNAARTLTQYGRHIYGIDNPSVAYDINGGFTLLAILYGNNDYYESIKVASLMGYDADCTAATVGGLLGIIKGMSGTHPMVKKVVYDNGNGQLVNDGAYVPYISKHYPEKQNFTDLADLYRKNMEKVILSTGGAVSSTGYRIRREEVKPGVQVIIPNRDFESNDAELKKILLGGAQGGIDRNQSFSPHSGEGTVRILTNKPGAEGKVFVQTENLEVGQVYKISAYLVAKGENKASLFVRNGEQFLSSSVFNNHSDWYCRTIRFTATDPKADIGLYVPPVKAGLFNAYLDDITIEACNQKTMANYEAEALAANSFGCTVISADTSSNASGNQYIKVSKGGKIKEIVVTAENSGEYIMRIRFLNNSRDVVTARVMSLPDAQAKFPFFVTGEQAVFEENIVEVPVFLRKGTNLLSLEQFSGELALDRIEIVSDSSYYIKTDISSEDSFLSEQKKTGRVYMVDADKLVIEQTDLYYTDAAIYTVTGNLIALFPLSPTSATYTLPKQDTGVYVVTLSGKTESKTIKLINPY